MIGVAVSMLSGVPLREVLLCEALPSDVTESSVLGNQSEVVLCEAVPRNHRLSNVPIQRGAAASQALQSSVARE